MRTLIPKQLNLAETRVPTGPISKSAISKTPRKYGSNRSRRDPGRTYTDKQELLSMQQTHTHPAVCPATRWNKGLERKGVSLVLPAYPSSVLRAPIRDSLEFTPPRHRLNTGWMVRAARQPSEALSVAGAIVCLLHR